MMTSPDISGIVISLILFGMSLLCLTIAYTDLVSRKIKNNHLIGLFVMALLLKSSTLGPVDILMDFTVSLIVTAATFILFLYRKMGAGDVKYIGVSFFVCGLQYMPEFSLVLFVSNIAIAIYTFSESLKFTWLTIANFLGVPALKEMALERNSIPFGVPISIANVLCIAWMM
ncbi:hypothetical protein GUA87_10530 [Sneathiella sp. P13V-1]|uniref:A24 family peptidase n=1 Tax=Sneathiella sp. P13V-1 TaxID=2697366 RepID=UPI00187BBD5E|nr:prepilin peptidase [Sneathiella sp. P13V-1]MBE7637281.1 hypothetical protein [Sneathiella sp. P13V-1]